MRSSSLLLLVSTCLSGIAVAASDAAYDDAVHNSRLDAKYMLDKFATMGFQANRTIENDDGTVNEFFDFDYDSHHSMEQIMLQEFIAAGPNNETEVESDTSTTNALAARQQGDRDSFSCKASDYYVYAYALNSAAGLVCGGIFTGATNVGVTYIRTRYLDDYRSRQVATIWKYTWLVPGYASSQACSTLMSRIVTQGCQTTVTGDKGTAAASAGGTVDEFQGDYGEASASITITRD